MAIGSTFFSAVLGIMLVTTIGCTSVISCATKDDERNVPPDAQIAYLLDRFVRNVRSLSIDAVIVRSNWLEAFDFATGRATRALAEEIRSTEPFANIGTRPVIAQISSVQRVFGNTFEIRWNEQSYSQNRSVMTERFIGRVAIIFETVRTDATQSNPFGFRVDAFEWARETQDASEASDRRFLE